MAEETPEVVAYDDSDLRAEVLRLTDQIDVLENRVVDEPPPGDIHDFVLATMRGDEARIQEFALASDTTTTAAGVVPDYLSGEIISIIDTARPFVASFQNDPIGAAGMSVVYPLVTQKPTVAVQAVENTEVETTAFTIGTSSFDLATYAGANRSSIQLIERSQPSFVQALFAELAGAYAIATETAAITTALTAVTQVEILADASTDAAATIAAFAAANTQVVDGVRRPATHVWCGSTRWEQLLTLVDTAGRPLVTWPGGGPSNAFGLGSLSAMTGSLSGLTLVLVPNMPDAADMIMGWAGGAANLEQSPQQLRALQVDTLSWELGVYGLYQFATKYPAAFVEFTVA